MIESFAKSIQPVLESPVVRRTRRNHGLEHATVHMLSRKVKGLKIAGRSTDGGFILIGDVTLEQVEDAAAEALRRMQNGEESLAVHPNCGTNLVTGAFLTTVAGMIGFGGKDRNLTPDRFSWTMTLMLFASILARPLGMSLQKHITTKGDPGDLEIIEITRREMPWPFGKKPLVLHRVTTRKG